VKLRCSIRVNRGYLEGFDTADGQDMNVFVDAWV